MRPVLSLAFAASLAIASMAHGQDSGQRMVLDETTCGALTNGYGPFDYRTATPEDKRLVEGAHFTPSVEQLKGNFYADGRVRNATSGGDIDYTLRAFPNHPRALVALMRLEEKERKIKPQGVRWPVPCYFERAVRFTPDDGTVRMVFGVYLLKRGDKQGAIRELELAKSRLGEDGNIAYNLGLAYFGVGRYDEATAEAKRARELGFPLEGLQKKLKQAGKWVD